jgi:DNA helicase HerA-like ATPase
MEILNVKLVEKMTQIGTVIATSESPSLESIVLILEKNSKSLVERGQFISISKNNSTIILGIVLGIKIYNAYYETMDASVHEIASNNYEAIFPIDEWESTRAEIKPLGEIEIKTGRISRLRFPVSPGEKAYISPPSIVSNFLGLDDNGIYLGKLHSNNVEIRVNLSRLLRKHLAILAISGAGKSYAASILIEEVYKHSKLGVICVDPHGEYSSVLPSIVKKEDIEVIRGSFITIGVPELNAWEISEFMPDISVVQTRELDKIISRLKRNNQTLFGLQDVIQKIEESETINPRTKDALIGWLDSLNRTYLFSAKTSPNPLEMVHPGKIIIFDLSDIQSLWRRRIIVLFFLKRLYNLRIQEKIPPSLFVVEEAHQFCPQSSRSVSKRIIETIAREGRKFYASLCLISQRPVNLSVTALSQCNSNLILRIRNPYDQDFIARTSEGIDRSNLKMIPSLEIGEALLVGEAINHPTFFRIRSRSIANRNKSLNMDEMADQYKKEWHVKHQQK